MSHINLPPGRWQLVSLRSAVSKLDTSAETMAKTLHLGEETRLPLVVRNLANDEVHSLRDGEAPSAANRIAGGLAAAALPAVSVDEAMRSAAQAETTCARERSVRLIPVVREAQHLLRWAATNARVVDTDVRNTIVAMADVFDREAATVEDEQKLLKAYEALTIKLAPVSVATIEASMQRLPPLSALRKGNVMAWLSGMTYGRFAHWIFFVLVLVAAALALAYQSVGSSALLRYDTLTKDIAKASEDTLKLQAVVRDKQSLQELAKAGSDAQAARVALNNLQQASDELAARKAQVDQLKGERESLPKRLARWVPGGAADTTTAETLDSARNLLEQFNRILLPLLFGLLGSYSYILRSISIEIRAQQFAPHSALHHIARLSLGALAGIAATWLLTPDTFGLSSTLPLWTLAFVAGYGTELIFAFMDRIVSALKS